MKKYVKLVFRDIDGILWSFTVKGVLGTRYDPGVERTPPYGPAFAFESVEEAHDWANSLDDQEEAWFCTGTEHRGSEEGYMLGLAFAEAHPELVKEFWNDRADMSVVPLCAQDFQLPPGTVLLDSITLLEKIETEAYNNVSLGS